MVMPNVENKKIPSGNSKKILLPRGERVRISEKLGTSVNYVCSTLTNYENGKQLKGETEISIVELAIERSTEYKARLRKIENQ
jgi:hypothetical protein